MASVKRGSNSQALKKARQYLQQGRWQQAQLICKQIIKRQPNHAAAWHLLGGITLRQGDYEAAIHCFKQAIVHVSDCDQYYSSLGYAYLTVQRISDAADMYARALQLKPDSIEALEDLAGIMAQQRQYDSAFSYYQRLLVLKPEYAEAHGNMGIVLQELGRLEAAFLSYQKALQLKPEFAQAHANMGNLLVLRGNTETAMEHYHQALKIKPGMAIVHSCMANVLAGLGQLDAALDHQQEALKINPNYAEAYDNMGNLLAKMGEFDAARSHYQQALNLNPDNVNAHSNLLFLQSYNVLGSPADLLREAKKWDAVHGAEGRAQKMHHGAHEGATDEGRRLRVGYVSPDFHQHSVSLFFESLLAAHDKAAVQVYCYAELSLSDAVTDSLKGLTDVWRDTLGRSDLDVAQQIHADGIDILVDLAGHTANNRLQVFCYKPAPIQVTYLGYFATTGLAAMDYWLTDEVLTPKDTIEQSTETVWRLPRCCLSYEGPASAPDVVARPVDAPLVLGNFNDLSKAGAGSVECWSAILKQLPEASLLLKARQLGDTGTREKWWAKFAAQGIERERIDLRGRTATSEEHLQLYEKIDIALDTMPRTGGATTAEALWMGVPVVSLAGERFIERLSATMLTAVGLDDLLATSKEAYIECAVALAGDEPRRQQLRAGMRERLKASPLCDHRDLAQSMEDAYRGMWQKHVKQQRN